MHELTSKRVDEFRMLRRYRKLQEDMPLSASKIEDDTLASWCSASKQMSFISLYLHLSSSIFHIVDELTSRQVDKLFVLVDKLID